MNLPVSLLPIVLLTTVAAWAQPEPLKPLPVNRATDRYESRAQFLQSAAEFETVRLRRLPFSAAREAKQFADARFSIDLGGVPMTFIKVGASYYTDGYTAELKAQTLAVENRAHDLQRWENMFEVDRRDRVTVPYDFFIAETHVTNAMFDVFVRETGYRTSVERYTTGWIVDRQAQWLQGFANDWRLMLPPMSEPDHPVVQVSWFDAMAFASWLSGKTGVIFRVPTKEEWLLAARPESMKDEVCIFPWGNSFVDLDRKMNFATRELADYAWIHEQFADGYAYSSPVRAFPANSRGLYDMLGNVWVWNWTNAAAYEARPRGDRVAQPAALGELGVSANKPIAMQGACYLARVSHANLLSKMSHPALDGAEDIGFRLVAVRQVDSGL